jgi:hypothetical protein
MGLYIMKLIYLELTLPTGVSVSAADMAHPAGCRRGSCAAASIVATAGGSVQLAALRGLPAHQDSHLQPRQDQILLRVPPQPFTRKNILKLAGFVKNC